MSEVSFTLTHSDLLADSKADPHSTGWWTDNVWHPFVNGTGVKQIYNNFVNEKLEPGYVAPAKTFSSDWVVQSLSSAGGAILTYSLAGKAAGVGLSKIGAEFGLKSATSRLLASEAGVQISLGTQLGMEGRFARVLASETTAQIVGAGIYDFSKAPNKDETRLGNAAGSVAAFSLFSAGNYGLASTKTIAQSNFLTGLGRIGVGALGGLTSLETSHYVSSLQGVDRNLTWDDRYNAMANGGFINFALPPLQKAITAVVDHSINSQTWGKGIPIERYLQYRKESLENRIAGADESSTGAAENVTALKDQLALLESPLMTQLGRHNPFARVKDVETNLGGSRADMSNNRVELNVKDGLERLAHELTHLQLGKMAEPAFKSIAARANIEPSQAEPQYYQLRVLQESASRRSENMLKLNQEGATPVVEDPFLLASQTASNGKTYLENWKLEFGQIQADPKFRPQFEYSDAAAATPSAGAAGGNLVDAAANKVVNPAETTASDLIAKTEARVPATIGDAIAGRISEPVASNHSDLASLRMGATVTDKGIDFAVRSPDAAKLDLLIYTEAGDKVPSRVIPMENTGGIWHVSVDGLREGTLYHYCADGPRTQEGHATATEKGMDFAVNSPSATNIDVLIYAKAGDTAPSHVQAMKVSAEDGLWHASLEDLPADTIYKFRVQSRFNPKIGLIDPAAKAVSSSDIPLSNHGDSLAEHLGDMPKAIAIKDNFDWQGDARPDFPVTDSIFYEMNVRGFTAADESLGHLRGTYRGIIEKILHLKQLGVNTVELMPIAQSDNSPWPPKNPLTGEANYDDWRYNPVALMAPDGSLAADGHLGQQVTEFKTMVRELHKNGSKVILDVVFNHTREGDPRGPTINLKGLANPEYYLLEHGDPSKYQGDWTGCGNTLSANTPMGQDLIMETMRYYVEELHVDGFRFDLAPTLKILPDGSQADLSPILQKMEGDRLPLDHAPTLKMDSAGRPADMAPFLERIKNDPVLSNVYLKVAEPWGAKYPEQYYLGRFGAGWLEWNGDFERAVRQFVKGDLGQTAALADRIAGSPGWYDASQGRHSVNIVTVHDGMSLYDLTAYNEKHNLANGEDGRDGTSDDHSWNCGYEGELEHANLSDAQKTEIEALRMRQAKNMVALLMLSRGIPLILSGDELLQTKAGNNNTWNQRGLNNIDWNMTPKKTEFFDFTSRMIDLRTTHGIQNLKPSDIQWFNIGDPAKPADFSGSSRVIAWRTTPESPGVKPLATIANAYWLPLEVTLPPGQWFRLVDTNLPNSIVKPEQGTFINGKYIIQPRSTVVLEGR